MHTKDDLQRHQHRRELEIPTLSVLAGPALLARDSWRSWADEASLPVLEIHVHEAIRQPKAWMSKTLQLGNAWQVVLREFAQHLRLPIEAALSHLNERPRSTRNALLEKVFPHWLDQGAHTFCREILLLGDEQDAVAKVIATMDINPTLPGHQFRLCSLLTLIRGHTPALLFIMHEDWSHSEQGLESAVRWMAPIVETCPWLAVGLAVPAEIYHIYVANSQSSHNKAILAEGLVPLAPATLDDVTSLVQAWDQESSELIAPILRNAVQFGASNDLIEGIADSEYRRAKSRDPETQVQALDAARSEAERLFFRLLEICPATSGLFELNRQISVAGWFRSQMEIDLLCESLKIAVELDGYYHFLDKDRYKRDRRKDFLLQKQGYLVVRFHADDLLSDLQDNLDVISAAIAQRQ